MKIIFIILGTLSLGIGILGIILPILPTTPFLLLTAYCYAKGSTRFHQWFIHTKLYKKHLETFIKDKSMTRRQKWTLMIVVDVMLMITFFWINNLVIRILIIVLILLKHLYFHTQVKMIPKKCT
jgi:uncharacterized membrane protein YbaN (DUF454 family)